MGLQIIMDIEGVQITEDPFSLLDSLGRARDLGQLALDNVWFPPGAAGAIIQPTCLTKDWPGLVGKWSFADYDGLDRNFWEATPRQAATDPFLQSKGLPPDQWLVTSQEILENIPFFVEFQCYAQQGQVITDYLIVQFGFYFRLHIHSNGTADFEDLRSNPPQILAQAFALTSNAQDLAGKFCQIFVLPWRRGRILIWTNQGGAFEVFVGARRSTSNDYKADRNPGEEVYYITTEAGQLLLKPSPLTRAYLRVNPSVSTSTQGQVMSPILQLPRSGGVTEEPLIDKLTSEQQDGTRTHLSLIYYDDGGNIIDGPTQLNPAVAVQYLITLTTPSIVFTPIVYSASIQWERGKGNREYETNIIGSPNEADFTMSRDRSQKTFSFTLDNPHNEWTSLKDLFNRQMVALLVPDDVDAESRVVFAGLTDAVDFTDGTKSRIKFPCSGLRKYLRSSLLSDSKSYQGMTHCQVVLDILHGAGFDPPNVIVEEDGITLDSAPPGEDDYWKPANGTSRDEFIVQLCETFSGYIFDDIGGVFYYVSKEYFTAAALAENADIPTVFMTTPIDPFTGGPDAGAMGPNATTLIALADSVQSTPTEPAANDIWVLGRDEATGEIIAAHYIDQDSISNRLAPNYVGERRLFIYASAEITNLYMAYQTCSVLAISLPQPIVPVQFSLPDYQIDRLPIEGPVYIEGFGLGLITDFTANLNQDRWRRTDYTAELL